MKFLIFLAFGVQTILADGGATYSYDENDPNGKNCFDLSL